VTPEQRAKLLQSLKNEVASKAARKKAASRLAEHEDLIREMRELRGTWEMIARHLATVGLQISPQAISGFWRRRHRPQPPPSQPTAPSRFFEAPNSSQSAANESQDRTAKRKYNLDF
jgi:hypothetical protein